MKTAILREKLVRIPSFRTKLLPVAGALLVALPELSASAASSYTITTNEQREVTVALTETTSDTQINCAFSDADVKSVSYVGSDSSVTLTASEPATYSGGTSVSISQLRFTTPSVFGTGPITLRQKDGSLVNFNAGALDLANTVNFAAQAWVMAVGNNDLKLHALASSVSPAMAYFGRSGGNVCQITFALDSPENMALDGIRLRGRQTVNVDGGTFKVASSARSDYFTLENPNRDSAVTKVSGKGFTVDVAEGGDVRFGLPLAIECPPAVTTNLTVLGEPANNSFEGSATGWTLNKGEISSSPAVVANSNTTWIYAECEDHFRTKFGESQLAVRGGNNVVSPSFAVTESGDAYVTFWMTSRPSKSGSDFNSDHLGVDVTLTSAGSSQTVTLPGRTRNISKTAGYQQYLVGPFAVEPGNFTVTLKVEKGDATSKALFFDFVQLCRLDVTTNLTTVVKTGAGSLAFDDFLFGEGLLAVRGGELKLGDSRLTDMTAEVAPGATLTVGGAARFSEAAVKVAADATVRFVDRVETNLIANPSFEDDVLESAGYASIRPAGWTAAVVEANDQNSYQPYFCQANGSTISETRPWTSAGSQTVALREKVCLKQTFTAPRAGQYRIAFSYACRDWTPSTNLRLHATVDHDGSKVALTDAGGLVPSSDAFKVFSATVELTAGSHELRFDADGDDTVTRGALVLIDDVVAAETRASDMRFDGVRLDLSTGSVLQLDNLSRLTVDELFVDGVRINGGRRQVQAAGVTVVGSGSIRAGEGVGSVVIFR